MFKHPSRDLIEDLANGLAALRSLANRTRAECLLEEYAVGVANHRKMVDAYNAAKPFWRSRIDYDTRLRPILTGIG